MKKTKIKYLFIEALISFAGCAKDSETGPQGPAGKEEITELMTMQM